MALTAPQPETVVGEAESPAGPHELLERFGELERQLEQVRRDLLHSHRLATLGTLSAMVAHEYHNLLTPIIGFAQFALSRSDDPALMRRALERALDAAGKAAAVSASILRFSAESPAQEPGVELGAALREAWDCIGRDPQRDGVSVRTQVPEVVVEMPALHLQQVLTNLLVNALNALRSWRGVKRLSVTARVEGAQAVIKVEDSGPGIPAQVRARLFEPFVTTGGMSGAEGAEETVEGGGVRRGTGLGLCICKDLVRQAGGSIEVRTGTGEGTTFTLRLPVRAGV